MYTKLFSNYISGYREEYASTEGTRELIKEKLEIFLKNNGEIEKVPMGGYKGYESQPSINTGVILEHHKRHAQMKGGRARMIYASIMRMKKFNKGEL